MMTMPFLPENAWRHNAAIVQMQQHRSRQLQCDVMPPHVTLEEILHTEFAVRSRIVHVGEMHRGLEDSLAREVALITSEL
jgi:hypothetical protein